MLKTQGLDSSLKLEHLFAVEMNLGDLPVSQYITELYDKHKSNGEGQLASYIPELGRADPRQFAIAIATADGFVYEVGDTHHRFSIQSISKPLVYGLALEDRGLPYVLTRIGVEPSGDPFNSITFDQRHNRPFNPMVNAGAIAAVSLVGGIGHEARFSRILNIFERFTGRVPKLDGAVYASESSTGHRNKAIAYLELSARMIDGNVDEHLDIYFRQCSLLVSARDLAIAAATLANDGTNPITGARALRREHVRAVLSVMSSCGMYDYAGEWQFDVGLPAKSGVSGGIMGVLPGQLGIGIYSPLLDPVGNSVRGVKVCEDLSRRFRLHFLEQRGAARTAIRRSYRGSNVRSKRMRQASDSRRLDELGKQIEVLELQGDLLFAEAEKISRRVNEDFETVTYFVLDAEHLFHVDPVAFDLLASVRAGLAAHGKYLVFAGPKAVSPIENDAKAATEWFPNVDFALESLENRLLGAEQEGSAQKAVTLQDFDILADMTPAQRETISTYLVHQTFEAGDVLVRIASFPDELFFLTRGRVNVSVPLGGAGGDLRVSTIDPGNIFGELALFGRPQRTANIIGTMSGEILVLKADELRRLRNDHPDVYSCLVIAVGRSLAERLGRANDAIRALAR